MLAARPFASDAVLLAHAARVWWALGREDWLEAFARHPRIGERTAEQWSRREQAGVDTAPAATRAALARRSEEHTSELQSRLHLVCRLLLEKKKNNGEAS